MSVVKINVNTDLETKEEAQKLFKDLGMDMTTAINIFLKRAVLEKGIPFEVSTKVPNAETRAALEEVRRMEKNPKEYKGYRSMEELKGALGV